MRTNKIKYQTLNIQDITISAFKFLYVNIQWAYDKRAGTRIKLIGDKLESHFAGSYSQEKLTNRNRVQKNETSAGTLIQSAELYPCTFEKLAILLHFLLLELWVKFFEVGLTDLPCATQIRTYFIPEPFFRIENHYSFFLKPR